MSNDRIIRRNERPAAPARFKEFGLRASVAPPDDGPFSLVEVAHAVRRRKWTIMISIVGGLLLALGASLLMTPKYQSTAVLEVNKESSDALGLDSLTPEVGDEADQTLDYAINMETHVTGLESDTLALEVINQLHLDARHEFSWKPSLFSTEEERDEVSRPLEQAPHHREAVLKVFHKNLSVKSITNTRMIEIHYLSPDRQVAADVVNTLASDYMDQYFLTRYDATAQASAWLSKQLLDLKTQVETAQQRLVDYQKQNGLLGIDDANNVVMTRLEELNRELTEAQAERITRQVINELVKSGNAELISGLAGDSLSPGSPALNSLNLLETLRAQQAQLKIEYAQAATKYGSAYPPLVEINNQLDAVNAAIQDEIQKLASRAQNDYLAALDTERMLEESFEKQKAEANNLNDKAIQYNILKHEADSSSNLYDELLGRLKSAGIISGLRSTKLLVIDPGRPGADFVHPNFMLNSSVGLVTGLLFGAALAFVQEGSDNTVRNPDQIEAASMLPQLGLIPNFRFNWVDRTALGKSRLPRWNVNKFGRQASEGSKPLAVSAPASSIADAYRQVRSSIVLSDGQLLKVLLVTSPLSGEGKTTTAINLAAVLAQQGARVLLVDADLRRPSIESRLGIRSDIGVSRILSEKNATAPTITEYRDQPGLFVLGAGPKPPNPAELLGSKQMAQLLEQLRSQFDFVVLDSSPVLSVTDAVVLAPRVDGVLLVARAEETNKRSLLRSRDILFRAKGNIAGFVVNDVNPGSYDYHRYGD